MSPTSARIDPGAPYGTEFTRCLQI